MSIVALGLAHSVLWNIKMMLWCMFVHFGTFKCHFVLQRCLFPYKYLCVYLVFANLVSLVTNPCSKYFLIQFSMYPSAWEMASSSIVQTKKLSSSMVTTTLRRVGRWGEPIEYERASACRVWMPKIQIRDSGGWKDTVSFQGDCSPNCIIDC